MSDFKHHRDHIREIYRIPDAWRDLGLPGEPAPSCRSPWRKDRSPSFSVYDEGRKFKDHGTGEQGELYEFVKLSLDSNFKDAAKFIEDRTGTGPTIESPRPRPKPRPKAPPPEPLKLSEAEEEKVHRARLALTNAFWNEEPIVDEILESLGLDHETLRYASWGSSGLGLATPSPGRDKYWLCYRYPQGLKWRNPDPEAKAKGQPRFKWIVGKATAPWRMEWVKPETRTIYLTESESDCLALIAAGIEADGVSVCVAAPGSGNFKGEWGALFKGKRTIICFDNDEAGRKGSLKAADALKGHAAEILTWKGGQQ